MESQASMNEERQSNMITSIAERSSSKMHAHLCWTKSFQPPSLGLPNQPQTTHPRYSAWTPSHGLREPWPCFLKLPRTGLQSLVTTSLQTSRQSFTPHSPKWHCNLAIGACSTLLGLSTVLLSFVSAICRMLGSGRTWSIISVEIDWRRWFGGLTRSALGFLRRVDVFFESGYIMVISFRSGVNTSIGFLASTRALSRS